MDHRIMGKLRNAFAKQPGGKVAVSGAGEDPAPLTAQSSFHLETRWTMTGCGFA